MNTLFEQIKENPLFYGIEADGFASMLPCINGQVRTYSKDQIVQLAGEPIRTVGLVISGAVRILREDSEGRQNLMTEVGSGDLFGEVFALAGIDISPVTVQAAEDCRMLHMDVRRMIASCPVSCTVHHRLIQNLLALLARKNRLLNQKIEILSKRTIRERLLLFLDLYGQGRRAFTLPYSREELAAYLCVDRSALSAEFSKLVQEGVLRCDRRRVELL